MSCSKFRGTTRSPSGGHGVATSNSVERLPPLLDILLAITGRRELGLGRGPLENQKLLLLLLLMLLPERHRQASRFEINSPGSLAKYRQ